MVRQHLVGRATDAAAPTGVGAVVAVMVVSAGQGRLADEDAGEGALGVHVGVGEQAQLLQLFGGQQVGLVDADDDAAAAFVLFGGEQVGGLAHDFGLVEAGAATQRGDDGDVEASGADGGVGDVDDLVAGAVKLGGGGADG